MHVFVYAFFFNDMYVQMYLFYAVFMPGITSPLMHIFWHMQMYARVHASVHENVHAEGSCLCVCVFAYANTRKCMRVRTGAQASQPGDCRKPAAHAQLAVAASQPRQRDGGSQAVSVGLL